VHLVAEGLAETAKKRLILEPTVMVILSRSDQSEIAEAIAQITQFQSMLPGNWFCVHLADIFDDERKILDDHVVDDERKILDGHRIRGLQHLDQWRELLQRTKTTTIQLELMRLVRLQLIYRYATSLKCPKIFVPDTADQLAKSTISVMALGRGVQIADMNSIVDRSHSAAIILRPMREISKKEVALVNRLEKSDRFVVLLDEKVSACKAIQPITDCFVEFLQREGFRSTITAVLATACKAKVVQRSSDERCRLCFVALSDEIMPVNLCSPCSTVIEDIDASSVRDAFLRCLSPFDSLC